MLRDMLPVWARRAHAIGAGTLLVLGLAHALGTVADVWAPTFFVPRDPAVLEAMRVTTVALGAKLGAPGLTVWGLHAGCSVSMAMGFGFMGALQLLLRRRDPSSPEA